MNKVMVDIGVICVKENELLNKCLESIRDYTLQWPIRYNLIVQMGEQPEAKNFNELLKKSQAPYLIYMNDDVEILHKDWLLYLLGVARIQGVGVVSCAEIYNEFDKQLYLANPDLFCGLTLGSTIRRAKWLASYLFCIVRHRLPIDIGFDENIPVRYPNCGKGMTDVDFCFQVNACGLGVFKDYRFRVYHHHKAETPEQYDARMKLYPDQMEYMRNKWENFDQDYKEGMGLAD